MAETVRQTRRMLALMDPLIDNREYVFGATSDAGLAARARALSLGWFNEDEGPSFILDRGAAAALGFAVDLPMRRIVLMVHSALDGVGLTAAVASALAAEEIPCKVVAAFRHDHVFVPSRAAERALAILERLQAEAARNGVPLLPRDRAGPAVTIEIVNAPRDEEA